MKLPAHPPPLKTISRGFRLLFDIFPELALAGTYLAAWLAPGLMRPGLIKWLLLVMLLEFIVIHSAAFMMQLMTSDGARAKRLLGMLGLGLF